MTGLPEGAEELRLTFADAEEDTWMSAQTNQRLAILGGTGLTGRQLIEQALGKGMDVTALARDPARLAEFDGSLKIVGGTVTDPATVERAVAGSSAVLSVLGRVKGSPEDLLTTSSLNIVAAMKKLGVRRIVVLTDTSVEDSKDRPPLVHKVLRWVLKSMNSRLVHDGIPAAKVITDSGLDWTLVRAPILTNGPKKGGYRVGPLAGGMPLRVSRADVADFMLSCVTERKFMHERPVIGG